MCGIVGVANGTDVQPHLITMLKRLEYRGYDSSGIAVVDTDLKVAKQKGKIAALEEMLADTLLPGHVGIGHTRWATHGEPNEANAQPHHHLGVAIAHNGIIENYQFLKERLSAKGHQFQSEADSEVIPHLISDACNAGDTPKEAIARVVKQLRGSFALAIVFETLPDTMFATSHHSPLVIGRSDVGAYLSSDQAAMANYAGDIYHLEQNEIAVLRAGEVELYDRNLTEKTIPWGKAGHCVQDILRSGYSTYTQKEIFQQPDVIRETLETPLDTSLLAQASQLHIVACGSSYYAASLAKYAFEQMLHLPVSLHIASEFRYYPPSFIPESVAICVSQSGETADTISALHYLQSQKIPTIGLTNTAHSQIARKADEVWFTHVGKEVGVAATKSFTGQVVTLLKAAVIQAEIVGHDTREERRLLKQLPELIQQTLLLEPLIKRYVSGIYEKNNILFLGRGNGYAAALEAALKVKELSYLQAEAYAAGELKHGPIALIESGTPVWICAPYASAQYEKILSNAEEVSARGAELVIVSNVSAPQQMDKATWITVPDASESITALLFVVLGQLLAVHMAIEKGLDVDSPRNLAKSVTVE
ncbi:MAG: glutamine--fructose-6-phosphate transaminase (isomerizing) [Rickettsiales bacterium]|nr:glutamine--fructose-6-phosphate transaminase (isomerizing) [Rickettsiales bacterium]